MASAVKRGVDRTFYQRMIDALAYGAGERTRRAMTMALSSKSWFGKAITASATTTDLLPLYEAACRAVEQAASVDEVKNILNQAAAMQACARQAHNKEMEVNAAMMRERAERRLGEMIAAQRDAGLLNPGTRLLGGGSGAGGFVADLPADLPTFKHLGIGKALANKARKASALPRETFEAALTERRRQFMKNTRVEPLLGIAKRIQTEARREARQAAAVAAMPPLVTNRYRLIRADMAETDAVEPASADHIITDPSVWQEVPVVLRSSGAACPNMA
jgi:hypothetical protein